MPFPAVHESQFGTLETSPAKLGSFGFGGLADVWQKRSQGRV
jgi:hypothetical protein